jgi:cystathionine beta-lyase
MTYNFDEIIPRNNTDCLKFDDKINRFGTEDLQPMWVADMDFRVPDCITETFQSLISHGIYGYHLKTSEYYNAIINWMQNRHNLQTSEEGIFFTPGVVPAVNYLIHTFTQKKDKIIVQPPVYYPFFYIIKEAERELVYNQLIEKDNQYYIDFEDLENKAKDAKMLILCSPHNPVGRVWKKEELERIAGICLKNNVFIVSDEIHNDLVFEPNKNISTASLSPEIDKITITCHAASKTFNIAGLSTAYVIINNRDLQKSFKKFMHVVLADALNTFGLSAMVTAYTKGEDWLIQLNKYLYNNYLYLKEYIYKNIPQLKISPLEATYMVWIDFRDLNMSDLELKKFIINKAHLGLNDGPTFGPGGQGFQRINIACPKQILHEGLVKLEMAVKGL